MENLSSQTSYKAQKFLTIVKFIIGVLLLPCIYAFTIGFIKESYVIESHFIKLFFSGIVSFLVFYLFLFDPGKVYKKGQELTEATSRVFSPVIKVSPYVIPIYSIIIFLIYFCIFVFVKSMFLKEILMYLIGVSIMFHLVFSARVLRARKNDFLMANYLFSFGIIYILNILLLAFGFSLLYQPFSWFSFYKNSLFTCRDIYTAVFTQLFFS